MTQLLTEREAADRLSVPSESLRYWRHVGKGPAYHRLGRHIRYSEPDLNRWLESQRHAAEGTAHARPAR